MDFRKAIKKQRGEVKKQAAKQPAFKSLVCLSSIDGVVKFISPVDGSISKSAYAASKPLAEPIAIYLDGVAVDELRLSEEKAVSLGSLGFPIKAGSQVELVAAKDVEITVSFVFTAARKQWIEEL